MAPTGDPQSHWAGYNITGGVAASGGTAVLLTIPQLFATEPEPIPCDGIGHIVAGEHIEYIDGLVVANCRVCDVRIVLARVPGGICTLKLKAFLGGVMGLEVGGEDENFRLADLLGLLKELRTELDEEESAVRRAHSMIDLAGLILQQKVAADYSEI